MRSKFEISNKINSVKPVKSLECHRSEKKFLSCTLSVESVRKGDDEFDWSMRDRKCLMSRRETHPPQQGATLYLEVNSLSTNQERV